MCLKGYRPLAKKEKTKTSWEYQDGDKDKVKSHNFSFTNTSLLLTEISKKNKHHGSHQGGLNVNATEIADKNKDKNKDEAKDLSHTKCYVCKQKSYFNNKYPKKAKI